MSEYVSLVCLNGILFAFCFFAGTYREGMRRAEDRREFTNKIRCLKSILRLNGIQLKESKSDEISN